MNKNVILYSTGCPKCKELKVLLDKRGVRYEENNSVDEMLALGFTKVPVLCVGEQQMEFKDAQKWVINNYKGES